MTAGMVYVLRGWVSTTAIAGRGRASSPAPEGTSLSPIGRRRAGRSAHVPSNSSCVESACASLLTNLGAGRLIRPASFPRPEFA